MTYSVHWSIVATDQYAAIWARFDDPEPVAEAAEDLTRALAHDPDRLGESREGTTRIVFHGRFQALFKYDPAALEVEILAVEWRGE